MRGFKQTVFALVATGAIVCLPVRPAAAAGPLLFAPWALGHIVLPLIAASVAASVQPQSPYPPSPGYYGGAPGYYASPNYYVRPPAYYAPPAGYYPHAYYRPQVPYAMPPPRSYAQRPGYYPSRAPYYVPYGGHASYRSGSFGYRRR
jgi:hypothetical protein